MQKTVSLYTVALPLAGILGAALAVVLQWLS